MEGKGKHSHRWEPANYDRGAKRRYDAVRTQPAIAALSARPPGILTAGAATPMRVNTSHHTVHWHDANCFTPPTAPMEPASAVVQVCVAGVNTDTYTRMTVQQRSGACWVWLDRGDSTAT